MSEQDIELPVATFGERFKPGIFDYIGPFMLFFVGAFVQTPVVGIGIAGYILGELCVVLGIMALLFINGYVPALNRGLTPNKKRHGVKLMKIVNKETMELRQIEDSDLGIMILRALIGWFEIFFIIPGLLPLIIISSSKYNQRLADMVANTIVIKTEPVEKFDLKEFRIKRSAPYPEEVAVPAKKLTEVKDTEAAVVKKTKVEEKIAHEMNLYLLNIGKIIVFFSSAVLLVCYIYFAISNIVGIVDTSILMFNGGPFSPGATYTIRNVLRIISYIVFFVSFAGFLIITLALEKEHRMPFYISSALYFLFIVLRIVKRYISGGYFLLGTVDLFTIVQIRAYTATLILDIITTILVITMMFFINSGIQKLNEKYHFNIKPYTAQIALIVFYVLYIATVITGASAQPTGVFAVVIFYCIGLFSILITLTLSVIFARLWKLRKIKPA